MGDLFPNEVYISQMEAREQFALGPGQFLQYASLSAIVKEIWTSFPAAPECSATLGGIINWGGGRHLITLFYRAMTSDRIGPPPSLEGCMG